MKRMTARRPRRRERQIEDGEKEETPEKKKKVEEGSAEPSPSERPPFPHRYKDQVAAVLDFLHKIETFDIPDPHTISAKNKDLIRCHIPNSAEARATEISMRLQAAVTTTVTWRTERADC